MPKVRIGIEVGMSIQVRGVDWVKPTVHCEVDFDDIPTDEELQSRWEWIWATQVLPQSDQLLDMMSTEVKKRLGEWREDDSPSSSGSPVQPIPPAPGAAY